MTIWVIIPAGGSSQRFGDNKLTRTLGGKPLLAWSINTFLTHPAIEGIVIVAPVQQHAEYQRLLSPDSIQDKTLLWASGGPTRRDSVWNGLQTLPSSVSNVLVHDAARPFVTSSIIARVLSGLQTHNAVISAIPVGDTLKQVSEPPDASTLPLITATHPRDHLWQAQTPQGFSYHSLVHAHTTVEQSIIATDDAQLVELADIDGVAIAKGSSHNIKITHPDDWLLAEAIAARWQE